jgi:type II secretory pathway component PulL
MSAASAWLSHLLQAVEHWRAIAAAELDDHLAVALRAQQQAVDALAVEVALLIAHENVVLRMLRLPAGIVSTVEISAQSGFVASFLPIAAC